MHKFAELNSAAAAQLFAAYCVAQGLEVNAVVQRADFAELYGTAEQQQQVQQQLTLFLQQPDHPRYQSAAWDLSQPGTVAGPVLPAFSLVKIWQQAPLTLLLLALCLLVYGWQQLDWRSSSALLQLTDPTQLWRWFTPVLLHFSLTHLVFNLAWWWYLGQQFERQLGIATLASVSLSIALISNAAQYFLVGANFGGLSGVVYGLFGYFWLAGRLNSAQGLYISNGLAAFMLLWLLLGFFDVLWVNMANWAHLGGLLAGIGWAWLLRGKQARH
ncbi:MAG: rhomboid family intramembrane serine protease GlpG [Gammaproteobacteria bacterium]|nr:rhomboid family intramembrane serine protease GlpG [Gammaproteobacteria bacterium]MBU1554828.1 rhomboid family intramembrane serine protease GlpG [Gammaproteobacteria bacterium]MBU2070083.1 rhomboid family intramembrane serine protease GlpG [Gammaproteobacteria bacterium]MBU2183621.1 rhomboid family intramembrane serine protease GlpG [Gammaproteobacteria bacterium]MBU2205617.1 rhomboid family intramembrane serine protease GlpG [Gammaproteobacteria bacterium]